MGVLLPLGEPGHARRLQLIAAETPQRKKNAHLQLTSGIFRFARAQRAFCRFLARQRYMNMFVSNVPGPPAPLYLAGARLLEVFPVIAMITGNMTLVAVMSYASQLNLTAVADRDGCPGVEVFTDGVRRALDEPARSVLAPAS
jgi:diacylglycerol O-acyltransferase / wax synthase